MAEKKDAPAPVRYQVLKKCFVNNTHIDPMAAKLPAGAERGKDGKVYVMAAPGLEGKGENPALVRANGKKDDQPKKDGSSEGGDPNGLSQQS